MPRVFLCPDLPGTNRFPEITARLNCAAGAEKIADADRAYRMNSDTPCPGPGLLQKKSSPARAGKRPRGVE